ncbi:MAG: hypothetical protein LBH00_01470 [Planctomycetaceae bacterium]|jgi:hypothetical protein|nr:hypothetical protein [Planctomycetaceae bacterium]
MPVRVEFIFALLAAGVLLLQIPVAVVAQMPAPISYDSLGYGSITAGEAPLRFSAASLSAATHSFQPVLVAQNTAPANIVPPVTPPPAPAAAVPAVLPPLDPYASASPLSTGSLLNIGNTGQASSSSFSGDFDKFIPETASAIRRFRDRTSVEYTRLPGGHKTNSFGMDKIDLRMQLAFPCTLIPDNGTNSSHTGFFYAAPGGSIVWWNGPVSSPGMAPNGFEAYVDFGAEPKLNDAFRVNAWGRFGIFSDFEKISSQSFRFIGKVEGIFRTQDQMRVHFGVLYLGRERVQWLPTGGIVWNPDENWEVKAVFPNPKISRRLWSEKQTEWRGYVCADYAGGSWSIDPLGLTDYNDVRLGMGMDYALQGQVGCYFEFGGSFARELYSNGHRWAKPPTVLYIKTGIVF